MILEDGSWLLLIVAVVVGGGVVGNVESRIKKCTPPPPATPLKKAELENTGRRTIFDSDVVPCCTQNRSKLIKNASNLIGNESNQPD